MPFVQVLKETGMRPQFADEQCRGGLGRLPPARYVFRTHPGFATARAGARAMNGRRSVPILLDYDSALDAKLRTVLLSAAQTHKAITQAIEYWEKEYKTHVPNAENQLFPSSLFENLPRASKEL